MKLRYPVRILVIDRSPAEAAALVAALRRADYVIQPVLAKDLQSVREVVAKTGFDLVLIAHSLKQAPLDQVMDILKEAESDAPLIVLDEHSKDATRLKARDDALRAGVVDIVMRDDPLMLEQTVRRELSALENRRQVSRFEQHQQADVQTLQWLVTHASERLAITRSNDIIAANDGFLDLFGIESFDPPWRDGLLDCVGPDEREQLRTFLDAGEHAGYRAVEIELQGEHRKQGRFQLLLDMAPASFHGKTGRRVIAKALDDLNTGLSSKPGKRTAGKKPDPSPPAATKQVKGKSKRAKPSAVADSDAKKAATAATDRPLDREHFLKLITEACKGQESSSERVGIVYVDLDDFAALKKDLGIGGVDVLVKYVVTRLRELAPAGTLVARVSDDDFALLVRAAAWEDIEAAYRKIEKEICGAILEIAGRSIVVSAGAGLTGLLREDRDPESVLNRAFNASLSELRPVVGVQSEPESAEEEQDRAFRAIAEDIEAGMKDGRLSLVYQPIVSLRGIPDELYEVFMRFQNGQGEIIPPREFIDAAADAGIGSDLDLWLIERVVSILADQHAEGRRTRLLVKVSEQALGDIRIPLAVGRGIRKHQIPPDRLVVEVCERSAVNQIKSTRTLMHALRGLKCATAIEHFGVTRKPFRLLEHIPVDYLTVDTSIVNLVKNDKAALERVRSIGSRAHSLGKFSCAEYVEDAASVGLLYDAGIDFVQGFYIQPPSPALDFEFATTVG